MAQNNHTVSFKKAYLSLENGTITEVSKEGEHTYRLLDELRKFEGEDRLVDITIKEVNEIPPSE